jgi:DNA polymerase-3 subunit alpha
MHLHIHSSHSLLDGLGTPEKYIKRAKELGQTHIAVTDHGVINSFITWQKVCEENDISPILGVEAYIVPDASVKEKGEKRAHMTILVKNKAGYDNLLKMMSFANLYGFYYKPRIDYRTILNHSDGLIFLSACANSYLNLKGAEIFLSKLMDKVGRENIYFEIMPHDLDIQKEMNIKAIELGKKFEIDLVASNDCHYVFKEESESHEVLLAIQRKTKWDNPNRWKFDVDTLYLTDYNEMVEMFENQGVVPYNIYSQALRKTIDIAKMCEGFRIEKKDISLPIPPQFQGRDEDEVLKELCEIGFEKIFGEKIKL